MNMIRLFSYSRKRDAFIKRLIAFLVLSSFILTNHVSLPVYAASAATPAQTFEALPENLARIKISSGMGSVVDSFRGGPETVILIQDAHAIAEAQENIQKLIQDFQKTYGVNLVALEGASAKLDAGIFRSFPDKQILKKTLMAFHARGELTGTTLASLLPFENTEKAVYQGIEDWALYEDGLAAYLRANEISEILARDIKKARKNLKSEKKKIYSPELLEIDRILEDFHASKSDFIEALSGLLKFQKPKAGTSLAVLAEEISRDPAGDLSLQAEAEALARQVRKVLRPDKLRQFNGRYQEFQTSRISPEAFAFYLKKIAPGLTVSPRLHYRIENQQSLKALGGTKIFLEFETYSEALKKSFLKTPAQKSVDEENLRLRRLEKLSKFELSIDEWLSLHRHPPLESGLWESLKEHRIFYENAEARDLVFFENLRKLKGRHKAQAAILIAGGFHTEGLKRLLKEKGISYAVVAPKFNAIPDASLYRAHMRGDVSWKNYFRVENGKINSARAFARALRDKLIQGHQSQVTGHMTQNPDFSSENPLLINQDSKLLLKHWRDRIIQDLATEGRAGEAYRYTALIDEALKGGESEWKNKWAANVESFIEKMGQLDQRNQLTVENISKILRPSAFTDWTYPVLSFADSFDVRKIPSSVLAEIRSEKKRTAYGVERGAKTQYAVPYDSSAESRKLKAKSLNNTRSELRRNDSERLKSYRKQLGLNQAEFGKILDPENPVRQTTISDWEQAASPVPGEIIAKAQMLMRSGAGQRLRTMRKQLGLNLTKFGKALNPENPISPVTISSWERGTRPAPVEVLEKAEALARAGTGKRLRAMRERLGLTQSEFGKTLDPENPVSKRTISNWEGGASPVPAEVFEKAEALARSDAGKRLQSLREQLGLNQTEFGRALDPENPVHRVSISNWERGEDPMPAEILLMAESLVRSDAGKRLQALRQQLGFTQAEFGNELNPENPVSKTTISGWERGVNPVPVKIMQTAALLVKRNLYQVFPDLEVAFEENLRSGRLSAQTYAGRQRDLSPEKEAQYQELKRRILEFIQNHPKGSQVLADSFLNSFLEAVSSRKMIEEKRESVMARIAREAGISRSDLTEIIEDLENHLVSGTFVRSELRIFQNIRNPALMKRAAVSAVSFGLGFSALAAGYSLKDIYIPISWVGAAAAFVSAGYFLLKAVESFQLYSKVRGALQNANYLDRGSFSYVFTHNDFPGKVLIVRRGEKVRQAIAGIHVPQNSEKAERKLYAKLKRLEKKTGRKIAADTVYAGRVPLKEVRSASEVPQMEKDKRFGGLSEVYVQEKGHTLRSKFLHNRVRDDVGEENVKAHIGKLLAEYTAFLWGLGFIDLDLRDQNYIAEVRRGAVAKSLKGEYSILLHDFGALFEIPETQRGIEIFLRRTLQGADVPNGLFLLRNLIRENKQRASNWQYEKRFAKMLFPGLRLKQVAEILEAAEKAKSAAPSNVAAQRSAYLGTLALPQNQEIINQAIKTVAAKIHEVRSQASRSELRREIRTADREPRTAREGLSAVSDQLSARDLAESRMLKAESLSSIRSELRSQDLKTEIPRVDSSKKIFSEMIFETDASYFRVTAYRDNSILVLHRGLKDLDPEEEEQVSYIISPGGDIARTITTENSSSGRVEFHSIGPYFFNRGETNPPAFRDLKNLYEKYSGELHEVANALWTAGERAYEADQGGLGNLLTDAARDFRDMAETNPPTRIRDRAEKSGIRSAISVFIVGLAFTLALIAGSQRAAIENYFKTPSDVRVLIAPSGNLETMSFEDKKDVMKYILRILTRDLRAVEKDFDLGQDYLWFLKNVREGNEVAWDLVYSRLKAEGRISEYEQIPANELRILWKQFVDRSSEASEWDLLLNEFIRELDIVKSIMDGFRNNDRLWHFKEELRGGGTHEDLIKRAVELQMKEEIHRVQPWILRDMLEQVSRPSAPKWIRDVIQSEISRRQNPDWNIPTIGPRSELRPSANALGQQIPFGTGRSELRARPAHQILQEYVWGPLMYDEKKAGEVRIYYGQNAENGDFLAIELFDEFGDPAGEEKLKMTKDEILQVLFSLRYMVYGTTDPPSLGQSGKGYALKRYSLLDPDLSGDLRSGLLVNETTEDPEQVVREMMRGFSAKPDKFYRIDLKSAPMDGYTVKGYNALAITAEEIDQKEFEKLRPPFDLQAHLDKHFDFPLMLSVLEDYRILRLREEETESEKFKILDQGALFEFLNQHFVAGLKELDSPHRLLSRPDGDFVDIDERQKLLLENMKKLFTFAATHSHVEQEIFMGSVIKLTKEIGKKIGKLEPDLMAHDFMSYIFGLQEGADSVIALQNWYEKMQITHLDYLIRGVVKGRSELRMAYGVQRRAEKQNPLRPSQYENRSELRTQDSEIDRAVLIYEAVMRRIVKEMERRDPDKMESPTRRHSVPVDLSADAAAAYFQLMREVSQALDPEAVYVYPVPGADLILPLAVDNEVFPVNFSTQSFYLGREFIKSINSGKLGERKAVHQKLLSLKPYEVLDADQLDSYPDWKMRDRPVVFVMKGFSGFVKNYSEVFNHLLNSGYLKPGDRILILDERDRQVFEEALLSFGYQTIGSAQFSLGDLDPYRRLEDIRLFFPNTFRLFEIPGKESTASAEAAKPAGEKTPLSLSDVRDFYPAPELVGDGIFFTGRDEEGRELFIKVARPVARKLLKREIGLLQDLNKNLATEDSHLVPNLVGYGLLSLREARLIYEGAGLDVRRESAVSDFVGAPYLIETHILGELLSDRTLRYHQELRQRLSFAWSVASWLQYFIPIWIPPSSDPSFLRIMQEYEEKILDDLILAAKALARLHELGIAQGDLSFGEIHMRPDKKATISDFGFYQRGAFDKPSEEFSDFGKTLDGYNDLGWTPHGFDSDVAHFVFRAADYVSALPFQSPVRQRIEQMRNHLRKYFRIPLPIELDSMSKVVAQLENVRNAQQASRRSELRSASSDKIFRKLNDWFVAPAAERFQKFQKIIGLMSRENGNGRVALAAGMIVFNFGVDFFVNVFVKTGIVGASLLTGNIFIIFLGVASTFFVGGLIRMMTYGVAKIIWPGKLHLNRLGLIVNFIPHGPGNLSPIPFVFGGISPMAIKEIYDISNIVERSVSHYTQADAGKIAAVKEHSVEIAFAIQEAQKNLDSQFNYRRFKIRGTMEVPARFSDFPKMLLGASNFLLKILKLPPLEKTKGYSERHIVNLITREDLSDRVPFLTRFTGLFFWRVLGIHLPGYKKGTRPLLLFGTKARLQEISDYLGREGARGDELLRIYEFDVDEFYDAWQAYFEDPSLAVPRAQDFIQLMFTPEELERRAAERNLSPVNAAPIFGRISSTPELNEAWYYKFPSLRIPKWKWLRKILVFFLAKAGIQFAMALEIDNARAIRIVERIFMEAPLVWKLRRDVKRFEITGWADTWFKAWAMDAMQNEDISQRIREFYIALYFKTPGVPGYEEIARRLQEEYPAGRIADYENHGQTPPTIERVKIPFKEESIPGYLILPGTRKEGEKVPVVQIYHGFSNRKETSYFDSLERELIGRGIGVLRMDLLRHGENLTALVDPMAIATFIRAVTVYLQGREDVDRDRLGLFGFSFGGYMGLRALHHGKVGNDLKAVTVVNPPVFDTFKRFSHVLSLDREFLEYLFQEKNLELLEVRLKELMMPTTRRRLALLRERAQRLLVFMGEKDRVVSPKDFEWLKEFLKELMIDQNGHRHVISYPNDDHYIFFNKEDMVTKTAEHFERLLLGASPEDRSRSELRAEEKIKNAKERVAGLMKDLKASQDAFSRQNFLEEMYKVLYETLQGFELKPRYFLDWNTLDFSVMKNGRSVGNLSANLFFRGDEALYLETGAEIIPSERREGLLGRFLALLGRILPEEIVLIQGIYNLPTLKKFLEGLSAQELSDSRKLARERLQASFQSEYVENPRSNEAEKWRAEVIQFLREVYLSDPALIPRAEIIHETILGKSALHYGQVETRLDVTENRLELQSRRSELRNPNLNLPQAAAYQGKIEIIKGGRERDSSHPEEMLDVLDADGNRTGISKKRSQIHRDGDWHETVHVYVVDSKGNLLLQKRAGHLKASPHKLQVSVSGHVKAGRTAYEDAFIEAREELGIDLDPERLFQSERVKRSFVSGDLRNNEFSTIYFHKVTDAKKEQIRQGFDLDEMDELWAMPIPVFRQLIREEPERFSNSLLHVLNVHPEILDHLESFASRSELRASDESARREFERFFGDKAPQVLRLVTGLENPEAIASYRSRLSKWQQLFEARGAQRINTFHELALKDGAEIQFFVKEFPPSSGASRERVYERIIRPELENNLTAFGLDLAPEIGFFAVQENSKDEKQVLVIKKAKGKPFESESVFRAEEMKAMARSLGELHAAGVFHGDLVFQLNMQGRMVMRKDHMFMDAGETPLRVRFIDYGGSEFIASIAAEKRHILEALRQEGVDGIAPENIAEEFERAYQEGVGRSELRQETRDRRHKTEELSALRTNADALVRESRSNPDDLTDDLAQRMAVSLMPGKAENTVVALRVNEEDIQTIIRQYKTNKRRLEEKLLAQTHLSEYDAKQVVMNSFDENIDQVKRSFAIGAVLPKILEQGLGEEFLRGFLEGLDRGTVSEMLKDGGKLPEDFQTGLKQLEIPVREIETHRPVVTQAQDQSAVPLAVIGTEGMRLNQMFLPFFIDHIEDLKNDPDALRWLGKLTSRALIHMADLMEAEALKNDPNKMKAELIKRLNLEGFEDLITPVTRDGQKGFGINAVLAQQAFSFMVRRSIESAA